MYTKLVDGGDDYYSCVYDGISRLMKGVDRTQMNKEFSRSAYFRGIKERADDEAGVKGNDAGTTGNFSRQVHYPV